MFMHTCAEKSTILGKEDLTITHGRGLIAGLGTMQQNHIPSCRSKFWVKHKPVNIKSCSSLLIYKYKILYRSFCLKESSTILNSSSSKGTGWITMLLVKIFTGAKKILNKLYFTNFSFTIRLIKSHVTELSENMHQEVEILDKFYGIITIIQKYNRI